MKPEIRLLLDVLEVAFGRGWQGTTLSGSLRGVTPRQALWRPAPGRHNVWELALHAAYWKYVVRRRITGETGRGGFPRSPSNWPALPESPTGAAWREDLRLLRRMHEGLLEAVAALPPRKLRARSPTGTWTYAQMIFGVAAHDVYHTGQIQLIKKLATVEH
ncbi:MAG TPA: DinB family protein [Gemmatimonadales bacterium]|nr:DinB family protein [Gemmatimonadales bacterium]